MSPLRLSLRDDRGDASGVLMIVAVIVAVLMSFVLVMSNLITTTVTTLIGVDAEIAAQCDTSYGGQIGGGPTPAENPTREQVAATIYSQARGLGLGRNAALIGIFVANAESSLQNLPRGDVWRSGQYTGVMTDSRGAFQQKAAWVPGPYQAWSGQAFNPAVSDQFSEATAWGPGGWAVNDPRMNVALSANLFMTGPAYNPRAGLEDAPLFKQVRNGVTVDENTALEIAYWVQRFNISSDRAYYISRFSEAKKIFDQIEAGKVPVPPFVNDSVTGGTVAGDSQNAGPVPPGGTAPNGDGLLNVGDSLMVGYTSYGPAPDRAFSGPVRSLAQTGVSLKAALAQWGGDISAGPSRVFVSLGTNSPGSVAEFKTDVIRLMQAAGRDRTVYWMRLHYKPVVDRNAALDEVAQAWPNLIVLDSAVQAARSPALLDKPGLHFTAEGYKKVWTSAYALMDDSATGYVPAGSDCVGTTPAFIGDGSLGAKAVALGLQQLGEPYISSGNGVPPDSWDCSKFTGYLYEAVGGPAMQRLSWAQYQDRKHVVFVPLDQAQPGDLLFYYTGAGQGSGNPISHVNMVLDPVAGTAIGAENSRVGVTIVNYRNYPYPVKGAPDPSTGLPTDGAPVAGRVVMDSSLPNGGL
jgi:cell wall-associated NlpC family hydrolase